MQQYFPPFVRPHRRPSPINIFIPRSLADFFTHCHEPHQNSSVVGGILSGVWAPKKRTSEASTRSASAGSSGGSAVGNRRAARGVSRTSAGQEQKDAAGGAGVSKSQPLGWVLSCVSGEPWDGKAPVESHGSGGRGGGREVRMKV